MTIKKKNILLLITISMLSACSIFESERTSEEKKLSDIEADQRFIEGCQKYGTTFTGTTCDQDYLHCVKIRVDTFYKLNGPVEEKYLEAHKLFMKCLNKNWQQNIPKSKK